MWRVSTGPLAVSPLLLPRPSPPLLWARPLSLDLPPKLTGLSPRAQPRLYLHSAHPTLVPTLFSRCPVFSVCGSSPPEALRNVQPSMRYLCEVALLLRLFWPVFLQIGWQ